MDPKNELVGSQLESGIMSRLAFVPMDPLSYRQEIPHDNTRTINSQKVSITILFHPHLSLPNLCIPSSSGVPGSKTTHILCVSLLMVKEKQHFKPLSLLSGSGFLSVQEVRMAFCD